MWSCLPADFQQVSKATGRDDCDLRPFSLDKGIGGNRRTVTQPGHVLHVDTEGLAHLPQSIRDSGGRVVGCRGDFEQTRDAGSPVIGKEVSKRAADVDTN